MAKTYKELVSDLARRGMSTVSDIANTAVDAVSDMPAQAAERVDGMKTNMTSKAEVVATTIEAKIMLEDRLMDDIRDEEFAYRLAQDENLRKTMNLLIQPILNPDPEKATPVIPKKDGSFLNLGAGLSTFYNEIQKKTPIEIEDAAKIEHILMSIDSGLDPDMAPDTRKLFFREAGMSAEQVEEMVPLSEYIIYETKMMDVVREEVQEDLGGRPITEEERETVDVLAQDEVYTKNTSPSRKPPARKGYVNGVYDGKDVSIKGSWSNHTFTEEELDKLFSGESITVEYTKKNGRVSQVSGKLEMQEYNGKEFFGFKPDFSKKAERPTNRAGADQGWDPNFEWNPFEDDMGANRKNRSEPPLGEIIGDPAMGNSPDESYRVSEQDMYAMFEDMPQDSPDESYRVSEQDMYAMFEDMPQDTPTYEETYGISAQDMYTMFSNGDGHIPDPETWTDAPMDDKEWAQIMELSGAEENYQNMLDAPIDVNMEMLRELEAQERARDADLMFAPGDLEFDPEEIHRNGDAPDFGIRDEDLAFAEQYAAESDMDFGIREEDLAFAEEMARQGL